MLLKPKHALRRLGERGVKGDKKKPMLVMDLVSFEEEVAEELFKSISSGMRPSCVLRLLKDLIPRI